MDPISIFALTGSVAGVLDILTRSLTSLSALVTRYHDAALQVRLVISQLGLLRSALSQLLQWMRFQPADLEDNVTLLNDMGHAVSTCELLLQTLEIEIGELHGGNSSNPSTYHKIMIAFDTTCKERQMQITHQTSAMNFLLQAVKCRSNAEREQQLRSVEHRQAMSDVEEDRQSLYESLSTRDPSVASVSSSRRNSLSELVFDLDREIQVNKSSLKYNTPRMMIGPGGLAPSPPPQLRHIGRNRDQRQNRFSLQNIPILNGKIQRQMAERLSHLQPLKGVTRIRSSILPIINITRETSITYESKALKTIPAPKVLLTGAACSGKTSLMHSMELLCTGKIEDGPQWWCIWVMLENAIERMINIIEFMVHSNIHFSRANQKYFDDLQVDLVSNINAIEDGSYDTTKIVTAIHSLWNDEDIRAALYSLSRNSYASKDSVFLFENVHRFVHGYSSTDDDILRRYIRTTGCAESIFDFKSLVLRFFDQGGARSERKKWIQSFNDVDVLVFVANITSWASLLFEDRKTNAMRENVVLFEALGNSRWFNNSDKILVLTNINGLQDMLHSRPLAQYFEDYTGGDGPESAIEYFHTKFTALLHGPSPLGRFHILHTDFDISHTQPAEQLLGKIQEIIQSRKDHTATISSTSTASSVSTETFKTTPKLQ